MNILILHAHTANRGDEAAVKAMVDEILAVRPDTNITICINGNTFYPNMPKQVKQIGRMPKLHSKMALLEFYLFYLTNARFAASKECKEFKKELLQADLVLHAPGGPSIGDIYSKVEKLTSDDLGDPLLFKAGFRGRLYIYTTGWVDTLSLEWPDCIVKSGEYDVAHDEPGMIYNATLLTNGMYQGMQLSDAFQ